MPSAWAAAVFSGAASELCLPACVRPHPVKVEGAAERLAAHALEEGGLPGRLVALHHLRRPRVQLLLVAGPACEPACLPCCCWCEASAAARAGEPHLHRRMTCTFTGWLLVSAWALREAAIAGPPWGQLICRYHSCELFAALKRHWFCLQSPGLPAMTCEAQAKASCSQAVHSNKQGSAAHGSGAERP